MQIVLDEIADKPDKAARQLLLSSNALNAKGKWARHEITQFWRPLCAWKAEALGVKPMQYVRVSIGFRYSTNHVRDTHNMSPVAKACLDGVVAAGLIPDDSDQHVESVTYYRHWPNGPRRVVLTLEEVE